MYQGVGPTKYVHGDVVGDDGLLLELELLEDSGLEDLLGDCSERSLAREFFSTSR